MQKTLTALSFVTAITASFSVEPLAADTEFENSIPIDLARSLLRGAGNAMDVRIYSDIPNDFPAFDSPDGATLVGSVDQEHSQQVVLLSDGDGMDQQAALIESLQENGYLLIERMPGNTRQFGFVSATPQNPGIPTQLCHDSQGYIYIRLQAESDRTFINITSTPGNNLGGYTCADRVAQMAGATSFSPFSGGPQSARSLQTSMPRLALPEEAATQSPRMPMFVSGSSDQMESKTEFSIDWSLAEVQEFFSEQIIEQDWLLDSEISGDRIAFGAWTKEDTNRMLMGTLQLVSKGDDKYEAVFAISHLD